MTQGYQKLAARVRRFYEQSREKLDGSSWLGDYVRQWVRWFISGIDTNYEGTPRPTSFVYIQRAPDNLPSHE